MAWYGDILILLPQFPERFGEADEGAVFGLYKQDILDYLDGIETKPLRPFTIPIEMKAVKSQIQGYEGFESIAFSGETVYLTIEASPRAMMGYVIMGNIQQKPLEIHLDPAKLVNVTPQARLPNLSDEALLVYQGLIYTFYEANGKKANPSPIAHRFNLDLQPQGTVPFPTIEYRLSDASPPDDNGQFWVVNDYFPVDMFNLRPQLDPLVMKYGEGPSHRDNWTVERLALLQITPQGIRLADRPPVQLSLWDTYTNRNWEAIALLDDRGFLLATDMIPGTILGFVPLE